MNQTVGLPWTILTIITFEDLLFPSLFVSESTLEVEGSVVFPELTS